MNFAPFGKIVSYIFNTNKDKKINELYSKLELKITNKSGIKILCLYRYSKNIRRIILDYKYKFKHHRQLAKAVSDVLLDFIHDEEFVENKKIYISYIPRHSLKSILYGGDHMKLLAQQINKNLIKMGLDVHLIKIIKRVKFTKSQFILNTQERKKNIKNAFRVAQKPEKSSIIFIIDDISKSANTFKATELTLKKLKKEFGLKIIFVSITC